MELPNVERHFWRSNCYHENCYKRLCDENKLQKAEETRTSGSENLIGCEVAETAPPKKLYANHLTMMVAKIVT
jgi:hypothetical protein